MIGIVRTKDKRYDYLNNLLENTVYSDKLTDFINIETLISTFNGVTNDLYFKGTNLNLNDIYNQNSCMKTIISGIYQKTLDLFCKNNKIKYVALINNSSFRAENAKITAEGLFRIIGNDVIDSFGNLSYLVLGYGYVGEAITKLINHYKTIDVFTIEPLEQKSVLLSNNNLIKDIIDLKYDIIINTIPVKIVEESLINDKSLIYDVSSSPFGFDDLNKMVKILPGIPGIILPKSSGRLIYEYVINEVS